MGMKLGFIGIGKIAGAIVEGLATSVHKDAVIYLSPRNEEKSLGLAAKYSGVHRLATNQAVLDNSDIVILALRPAVAAEVLSGLRFSPQHTVISLIPLVNYADLTRLVSPAAEVSLAIPLPTVVRHQCPIPVFRASEKVIGLFRAIGQPLTVADEGQLHAIWTLTGLITPFYEQLGALSDWTVAHGVSRETANAYIANLFQSLSYMAQHSDPIDFGDLAQHAATPNGMNEQAGRELREKGVHEAYKLASDRLLERFN
jgi:pyrroline-5-carboxylate reductase